MLVHLRWWAQLFYDTAAIVNVLRLTPAGSDTHLVYCGPVLLLPLMTYWSPVVFIPGPGVSVPVKHWHTWFHTEAQWMPDSANQGLNGQLISWIRCCDDGQFICDGLWLSWTMMECHCCSRASVGQQHTTRSIATGNIKGLKINSSENWGVIWVLDTLLTSGGMKEDSPFIFY